MADLDRQRIATAALAVADLGGVAGFTMRAVADALGVTPMALYHHVDDKAALAALVVDAAIREHPLPPPADAWRDDLWTMACWMRTITLTHPVVGHLRRAYRVWTPAIFPMTQRWFDGWARSGLPRDTALTAAVTSSLAVVGIVEEEMAFRDMDRPDETLLAAQPDTHTVFTTPRDPAADFDLLIHSLIDGLHTRLSRDIRE